MLAQILNVHSCLGKSCELRWGGEGVDALPISKNKWTRLTGG